MTRNHREDIDFMEELEAATNLRPAKPAILLLLSIIALLIFLGTWAALAKVEEITRGQGQVVPSQDVQYVQSLEGGVLQELLVREGELVKKGQILMRISDIQFSSEERGVESRSLSLRARKARLEAEAEGTALDLPEDVIEKSQAIAENEEALYQSRQKELQNAFDILDDKADKAQAELNEVKADINRLVESRKLLQEELRMTRQMVSSRAVPKLEQIRLERELNDISGKINANSQKRSALEAALRSVQNERKSQTNVFRSKALKELGEVETEIQALEESLKSIGDRVSRTEIRAPVDGIVNKISIKTIGGVVEPAKPLAEIVPIDDELKIVAKVSPNDIAFIRPGQPAKVKITAYDPQKYGSLNGELVRVGANSITDKEGQIYFELELRTEKNHIGPADNPLPITPGMIAEVEIITGKRTILSYLLKPLLRARDRAFTER